MKPDREPCGFRAAMQNDGSHDFQESSMFVHTVYFTLNEADKDQAESLIADCQQYLGTIDGVVHLWTGRPVPSDRPGVDGNYDVGLSVVFANKADHDAYQSDEKHLAFIEKNKATWAAVKVTDFA